MKINIRLPIFIATIILGLMIISPTQAALQKPGELPIVEPLRPTESGVAPNYSGNIQDGEAAKLEDRPSSDKPAQENIAISPNPPAVENNWTKLLATVVLIIFVISATVWYLNKKHSSLSNKS